MLDVIMEVAGGPILAILFVGTVLFLFGARRFTAVAHLVARGTVGKAARGDADPVASLSFDERVAARLKELEADSASASPPPNASTQVQPGPAIHPRGFGRRGSGPS